MPSTSYYYRVEQVSVITQRSGQDGVDTDALALVIQVGDGAATSASILVFSGAKSGTIVDMGYTAQTPPIDNSGTIPTTVSCVVSQIAKPEQSVEASLSAFVSTAKQVATAISGVAGFVGIPGVGRVAKIFEGALQGASLIGTGPPDCTGPVFTKTLPAYTPEELGTYTAGWATHRPPAVASDPIAGAPCGTNPSTTIAIAIEKVSPAIAAVALAEATIEVVLCTPNQAPQIRSFDAWDPPGSSSWTSLGGAAIWAPSALCVTTEGITPPFISDLFIVGTDQNVYTMSRGSAGDWPSSWTSIGGPVGGSVVAVSPSPDRIDVFGIGRDDRLLCTCNRIDGQWSSWVAPKGQSALVPVPPGIIPPADEPFGPFTGNLAVASVPGSGPQFQVYALDCASTGPTYIEGRALSRVVYNDTHWLWDYSGSSFAEFVPFRGMGGDTLTTVASAASAAIVNFYVLGEDSSFYSSNRPGEQDVGWDQSLASLGGTVLGRPAVVSLYSPPASGDDGNPGSFTYYVVFGKGTDGQVYYRFFFDGEWQIGWTAIGMPSPPSITAIGDPAVAFCPANNRLFVFVVGSDERLYWKYLQCGTTPVPTLTGAIWVPSAAGWLRDDAPAQPNPWHEYSVSIDQIRENFPVTADQRGMVQTTAEVRIGADGTLSEAAGGPIVRDYRDGTSSVAIHVEIQRTVTPRVIQGTLKQIDNVWWVFWRDGTKDQWSSSGGSDPWTDIPGGISSNMVVTKSIPEPASPGLAREFDLTANYTSKTISGTVGSAAIAGTSGQPIHIAGDSSNPDVWLTITMTEARSIV